VCCRSATGAAPLPTAGVSFSINGRLVNVSNPDPSQSLGAFLRTTLGLTGTKLSCEQGGCGACVVARVSRVARGNTAGVDDTVLTESVNSCLLMVPACDGHAYVTAEHLVDPADGKPHPVQTALAERNGTQCGFCSPGFVMGMWSLLQRDPAPKGADIEAAFDGHLCRCTGYRPIFDAMQSFAGDKPTAQGAEQGGCCSSGHTDIASNANGCRTDPDHNAATALTAAEKNKNNNKKKPGCTGTCGTCAHAPACGAADVADIEDMPRASSYDPAIDAERRRPAPAHIAAAAASGKVTVTAGDGQRVWVAPTNLTELFAALDYFKDRSPRLVGGNTGAGIYQEDDTMSPRVMVFTKHVAELTQRDITDRGVYLGAGRTITELMALFAEAIAARPGAPTQNFTSLLRHMGRVANVPVRNEATWAGNLCIEIARRGTTEPFQSDLVTILTGAGATVTLACPSGTSTVAIEDVTAELLETYVVAQLNVPFLADGGASSQLHTEKVMLRHQNSHAIVNCAVRLTVDPATSKVTDARVAFGGIWSYCGRCPGAEQALVGAVPGPASLAAALAAVREGCVPDPNQPRVEYRARTALAVFYKMMLRHIAAFGGGEPLPASLDLARGHFLDTRAISTGTSTFPTQPSKYPLYEAIPAVSAIAKTTGDAEFVDDIPFPAHGLFAALVVSTVASGTIKSIDTAAAAAMPGFVAFYGAADIPGTNSIGEIMPGKELFASEKVIYLGQSLGVVVATSYDIARNAARAVAVTYATQERPVVGIDAAKAAGNSFDMSPWLGPLNPLSRGSIEGGLSGSEHVLKTTFEIGSQYAFYMENQTCAVIPAEGSTLRVFPSTQAPRDLGIKMSAVLATTANRLDVRMVRSGGAFGSKGSMSEIPACAAALAATKLRVPVKIYLDKVTDFRTTGKRHPYRGTFRVGYSSTGVINTLEMLQDIDGGNCLDETVFTVSLSQLTCDNNYNIPNFTSAVSAWHTNTASNTSVRAPGAIQVATLIEHAVEAVAAQLGVDPAVVQAANFYTVSDPPQVTPYGQPITPNSFASSWKMIMDGTEPAPPSSNSASTVTAPATETTPTNTATTAEDGAADSYSARRAAVEKFNAANRWNKRGIYAVPIKYGVGSAGVQGGALVSIAASDGSVTVSHGACELGQGAETKVQQAVAATLGCALDNVRVAATATADVSNALQTGGSVSSNVNAEAAIMACEEINTRIASFRTKGAKWADIVAAAWAAGTNLQAVSVCVIQPGSGKPGIVSEQQQQQQQQQQPAKLTALRPARVHPRRGLVNMPPAPGTADPAPFNYSAFGAAVTEVEIDVLTGQVQILRSDIVYDCGTTPAPLIDLGQIQGCFASFGVGHFLTEEVVTNDDGLLTTDSTWSYKPTSSQDIPIDFRVTLRSDTVNKPGTFGSASAGEPPLFGAISIFFAVKQAVRAARTAAGITEVDFPFNAPATVDVIANACGTTIESLNLDG
jgi:xanthine dehydrogenase/oxidase